MHRLQAKRLPAQAREGEEIVDQVAHVLAVLLHPLQESHTLLAEAAAEILEQDAGIAVDRPQWCPQVVGD